MELEFYQDRSARAAEARAPYGEPQFDHELVRRLLRFLHEPVQTGTSSWTRREINMHALRDGLRRRPVILRELVRQARRFPGFEPEYRKIREQRTRELDRMGLAAAAGPVLPAGVSDEQLYAVLRSEDTEGDAGELAVRSCDRVSVFTWYPRFSSEARCLTRFTPAPTGALDFHSLGLTADEGRSLFERKLTENQGRVVLCARALKPAGDTGMFVDLGVGTSTLTPRHIIDVGVEAGHGSAPVPDDVVFIEVVALPRGQTVRLPAVGAAVRQRTWRRVGPPSFE